MPVYSFPLEKHLVIFRPTDNRLFLLNPTAGWIWQATAAGMDTAEITELLAEQYSVPGEEIIRDVRATMAQWQNQGLDPAQPEVTPENPADIETDAVPTTSIPADQQISFQQSFIYGQNSFTLAVYPQELTSAFAPLINTLPPLNGEADISITIFKENNDYIIVKNQQELERTPMENIAVGRVLQAMVEFGYPDTTWMAYIHASAGALGRHGVIFPAIGGSGKSTLMAALCRCGWTYWGDDTVPLDIGGKAGAMHLNQCIKSGSWEVLKRYYPDIEKLPVYNRYDKTVRYLPTGLTLTAFKKPLPVHKLIFPCYSANCDQSIEPISAVQALQFLIDSQTWISPDPAHAETMINWISTIPSFTLKYHDLDWAAENLKKLIT